MRLNPYAAFDVLAIGSRLPLTEGEVVESELYLFAYFACLLLLFKGRSVSDWGYVFAGTKVGAPYSTALDQAVAELAGRGLLLRGDGRFHLTDAGRAEYEVQRGLGINRDREVFLEAACSCAVLMPQGLIRAALATEPELKHARRSDAARPLLERGPGLTALEEHFKALSSMVAQGTADLVVPAHIWLTYLNKVAEISRGEAT